MEESEMKNASLDVSGKIRTVMLILSRIEAKALLASMFNHVLIWIEFFRIAWDDLGQCEIEKGNMTLTVN